MTTRFEIRSPDLSGIFISFDYDREAIRYWHESINGLPPTDMRHGAVVVRHTFESHAEAETARLDFMISPDASAKFAAACLRLPAEACKFAAEWPKWARRAIDVARNAPQPSTVIIWPKPAQTTETPATP